MRQSARVHTVHEKTLATLAPSGPDDQGAVDTPTTTGHPAATVASPTATAATAGPAASPTGRTAQRGRSGGW
jgi:hypothetical protein